MELSEFSNTFDTLLNSYSTQAQFGEQASARDISLDEYEKSVLLTQAQDIIVKSYFDRSLNPQGQGFDDSARRQVDFSSLIKVQNLQSIHPYMHKIYKDGAGRSQLVGTVTIANEYSERLVIFLVMDTIAAYKDHPESQGVYTYIQDKVRTNGGFEYQFTEAELSPLKQNTLHIFFTNTSSYTEEGITYSYVENNNVNFVNVFNGINKFVLDKHNRKYITTTYNKNGTYQYDYKTTTIFRVSVVNYWDLFDDRGVLFQLPAALDTENKEIDYTTEVLFILNEKLIAGGKSYVIIPISYTEYDREMSKPYAQPLKKQAWRLFQNDSTGFDILTEVIPREEIDKSDMVYRIRYVKRPRPIILEKMPSEDLKIDGFEGPSKCELNPILHMDILNKAVELAIATRSKAPVTNSPNQNS